MLLENLTTTPEVFPLVAEPPPLRTTGVQELNPLEHSDWDAQIAGLNHPARGFFHSAAWATVLAETYGCKPTCFVTRESGAIHALLPFMEVRSRLTGNRAVALPFTDSCEPLCADRSEFEGLFRNAVEFAKGHNWKYLELRGGQRFLEDTPPSLSFYGHSLDLPANENVFFGELKDPVRRAIRKAKKSGIRVEISRDLDAVKCFYSLHCKARRKHGLPPQPFLFFKNIHRHVLAKDLGIVVLARSGKIPIAGAVFFHGSGPAVYKFGASDNAFQHLRGNNLVFWEAIRWFSRHGAKKMDLGRTSITNEGLRRFKLGWNAGEKNISYFRFCLLRKKFVSMSDQTSGWHTRVFNALPLLASRIIGEVLYRHWA